MGFSTGSGPSLRQRFAVVAPAARPAVVVLLATLVTAIAGPAFSSYSRFSGQADTANSIVAPDRLDRRLPALVSATGTPAPTKAAVATGPQATAPRVRPKEVFGFAPWWTLDKAAGFDYRALTTVAYFGVDIHSDALTIEMSGKGWDGLNSPQVAQMVSLAHANQDRVVLTVKCFDQGILDRMTGDQARMIALGSELGSLVKQHHMDGVNIDFEGFGGGTRSQVVQGITTLSNQLHALNPAWQVTVDTYANSASKPDSYFDPARIAPHVDALFVMTYDMYMDNVASPHSALYGYSLNDELMMTQYAAVVPSTKVIMGIPFYGYDWVTADARPNSPSSSGPSSVPYADIVGMGGANSWDPIGSVPVRVYRQGGQWHELYFDNPKSIAEKAALYDRYHLGGLGIWALGFDGNDGAMYGALVGSTTPAKEPLSFP